MKQKLSSLTLAAICGLVISGHASADETIFDLAKKQPTGFISQPELMAHEGGSSGGGGDGLYLNNAGASVATVIQAPSELNIYGFFTVKGNPGLDQPNTYVYRWCPVTPDGKLDNQESHCKENIGYLDQPTHVLPGFIVEIEYSNSFLSQASTVPVKIDRDQHLTFELKPLEVHRDDSTFHYRMYFDLTDEKNLRQLYMRGATKLGFVDAPPGSNTNLISLYGSQVLTPSLKVLVADGNDIITDNGILALYGAILSKEIAADEPTFLNAKLTLDYFKNPSVDNAKRFVGPNGGLVTPAAVYCYVHQQNVDNQENDFFAWITQQKSENHKQFVIDRCTKAPGRSSKPESSSGERFLWVDDRVSEDDKEDSFADVFPGTYGIKFTSDSGQVSIVHGIQVK